MPGNRNGKTFACPAWRWYNNSVCDSSMIKDDYNTAGKRKGERLAMGGISKGREKK
jgi:hypothetical protein